MKKNLKLKLLNYFFKFLSLLGLGLVVLFLFSLSIKGEAGNPLYFQTELSTKIGGPFESSGTNSRYALTKSIVDSNSFFFTEELAKFASPDLTIYKGRYTTLFTPGVSFAAVPFYYLGKLVGVPQFITFLSTLLFASFNILLIYLISRKLKATKVFSLIAGLIFAFGTNGLGYSSSMTQHHLSVLLILLVILNSISKRNLVNNLVLGLLIGAGILVDIPNAFMMAPAAIYAFFKHFQIENVEGKSKLKINPFFVAIIVGLIPMAVIFGWYNYSTNGSFTVLAQSIGRSDFFATDEIKEINKQSSSNFSNEAPELIPFATRLQFNGAYILLISNERGIFFYNPILFFGLLGLFLAYKNRTNNDLVVLITAIVLVNITMYSMFGDPWGGWSYGPRYLIPSIALLSVGIGYALTRVDRNPFAIILFAVLTIYSVSVSVLGSVTTNLLPPKVEAENLATPVPYTYLYNYQMAERNQSGVLIYNLYLKNIMNVKIFIYVYSALIVTLIFSLLAAGIIFKEKEKSV